jgi:hypothetical protein
LYLPAQKQIIMKKIALISLFKLVILSSMSAQYAGTVRFGVQSSPTWSWINSGDKRLESTGINWGARVGAMGEYYFADNYAIVSGIGFGFNQGGTFQNGYSRGVFWPSSSLSQPGLDTLPLNAKLQYRITNVEIPLGLKMKAGKGDPISYYAEIPVLTFGFVNKATGDVRGTNNQNTADEDIREDVNGLVLSWGLGGGIEYSLGERTSLTVGLSYQQQFTDLTNDAASVEKSAGNWSANQSKGVLGILALRAGLFF